MDELTYFRDLYDAFNRRDVEYALAKMSENVDWPNAWAGGRLVGRHAVRTYWREQWSAVDPTVTPLSVSKRDDGSLAVTVRQVIRSLDGETQSEAEVLHVYEISGGLITRMAVEEMRR